MQPAGSRVRTTAELAASVQLGHDHLNAGQLRFRFHINWYSPAVVTHLCRTVRMQCHDYFLAEPRKSLVHPVIHNLPEAVHQTSAIIGPDIHTGALTHRLKALQHGQVLGGVAPARAVHCLAGGGSGGFSGGFGGHLV